MRRSKGLGQVLTPLWGLPFLVAIAGVTPREVAAQTEGPKDEPSAEASAAAEAPAAESAAAESAAAESPAPEAPSDTESTEPSAPPAQPAGEPPATAAPAAPPGPTADKGEGVEEILVTGSRIGRSNLDEFAHITVLSSETIATSGVATIDDLLRKMPSVTLQGLNKQKNNDGWGLSYVDLRNLGVERTLVLVNGRRFVKSGGIGEVNYTGVDMNNIPVQMIDRVEVLLDGASAAYGSDAVGGVVNIILKDDFEGLLLDASTAISDKGDGTELTAAATVGSNFNRGNVTVHLSYMRRTPVKQADRDWAKEVVVGEEFNDDGSVRQYFGSSTHPATHVVATDEELDVVFIPDASTGNSYTQWNHDEHYYNYGAEQWLVGKTQRFSVATLGSYRVGETAKLYLQGLYTGRQSRNKLAPQPIGFGTAVFPDNIAISVDNPYMPADFRAQLNPGTEYVWGRRRMAQVGNRLYDNESNTFQVVAGVKGKIIENIDWDLYANYGQNQNRAALKNSVNLARVFDTADPELCAQNAARGCVVGNYFGDDTLSPEVLDYIRSTERFTTFWDIMVVGGSTSAKVVELPGGMLGLALGAEARWESGYSRPDAQVDMGEASGNLQDATHGKYNNQEAFIETSLPLASGLPGIADLTVDLAARYAHYDTFGSDFSYRSGLSWAPIEDLRLRGVYATAFRAPSIVNLYSGATDSFEAAQDPCNDWESSSDSTLRANCASQGVPGDYDQNTYGSSQIRTNVGGNPDLDAETAVTFNAGLVFTPAMVTGLTLTFDYYNITVDNAIDALEPQYILDSCYRSAGLSHPNCKFIEERNVNSVIPGLQATLVNVNEIRTSGLDFTLDYLLPLSQLSLPTDLQLSFSFHGNYMLAFDRTLKQEGEKELTELDGTISSYTGSYAHLRWLGRIGLHGDNWTLSNTLRYIGGADVLGADPEIDPTSSVPAVYYWDLVARIDIDYWDGVNLSIGINNLLDKDPPFLPEGGQNANLLTYDFIGRYMYAKLGVQL